MRGVGQRLGVVAVAVTATLALGGCGSALQAESLVSGPHVLSTKCGIQYTYYGGQYWETTPMGNGKVPKGWPNGVAEGQMKVISDKEIVFISPYKPKELTFHPSTGTPSPCPV